MTALLSARGLRAGYGSTVAIRDIDIDIEEGEIVALLGSNGAGKSTTMLALAGVLPRMGGTILFEGVEVQGQRAHLAARRGLALVPEQRALFRQLTVRENLRLGMRGGSRKAEEILDYFPELASRLNVKAGLLSGGEQQMLALGRALVGGPRLLLIDEMSLGLAPVIVQRLLEFLGVIRGTLRASILLVEQQVENALEVSDRAYLLSHGEMQLSGSSAELIKNRKLVDDSYFAANQASHEQGQDHD